MDYCLCHSRPGKVRRRGVSGLGVHNQVMDYLFSYYDIQDGPVLDS